jgi:hypothetical protein
MSWRVRQLKELERRRITDRASQARELRVSLPHLNRIRRAARAGSRAAPRRSRSTGKGDPSLERQFLVRLPAFLVERLRRFAESKGVSMSLATWVALQDWLDRKGAPGQRAFWGTLGEVEALFGESDYDSHRKH